MKRALLAGLLLLPFGAARAQQHDAYGSLVGMAASPDKGPETETVPPDMGGAGIEAAARPYGTPAAEAFAPAELRDAVASAPSVPAKPRPARRKADSEADAPSVAVPAAAAPRAWTKFFASLLPPHERVPSFEVAPSTAPRRARPEPVRPATAASAAGSAQGLLEVVAAATSPSLRP